MSQEKTFITIAGNIGTGKTSLTEKLAQKFGWEPHFESVTDNPYLEDFYKDMGRWSFQLQVFFLNHRYAAHKSVTKGTFSAIQDRSIYEDANIFARNLFETGLMSERDYKNYFSLYQSMTAHLGPPDLMVYLRKSVPRLKTLIAKRGRSFEQSITETYLQSLNTYYDEWIRGYNLGPKLWIETDDLDFVSNEADFEQLSQKIVSSLNQRDLFLDSKLGSSPGLKIQERSIKKY